MIKIVTKKIVNKDGIESRKIVDISGVILLKDLPLSYVNGFHFRGNSVQEIDFRNALPEEKAGDLYIGKEYPEIYFQETLEAMRRCGNRLHEINVRIAEKKAAWIGDETFII